MFISIYTSFNRRKKIPKNLKYLKTTTNQKKLLQKTRFPAVV